MYMQAKFFIAGDIINTQNQNGRIISEDMERVIGSCDYAICNFEAPIEGYGKPIVKSGPHLQNKISTVKGLREQGFNLLLLANNHMMDYGQEAMDATKSLAEEEGLDTVGAGNNFDDAYRPLIKEINNLKFGIINACEAQFGVLDYHQPKTAAGYAWINHNQIDKIILHLKQECDFVLVFSHAGLENYSIPQKEWRERYKHLCDLGADVIIGCHPHVPQGYEQHGTSLIFYSLGNFYFDRGRWAESKNTSFALKLFFKKDEVPTCELVFHVTDVANQQVRLAKDHEQVDIEKLNVLLHDEYEQEHTKMSLDAYKNNVNPNLLRGFIPFPLGTNFKSSIKELLATLLGRRRHVNKSVLSLHLMRNEAYYFVTRNAMEILVEKTKNE